MYPSSKPRNVDSMINVLSYESIKGLERETLFKQNTLSCLFEQFMCIANTPVDDIWGIGYAIDRNTFRQCLGPIRDKNNLICRRLFRFYDSNDDNVIDFGEYVFGLSVFATDRKSRLWYVYQGCDVQETGYVTRMDIIRILRAHYSLSRDLLRDVVKTLEAEGISGTSDRTSSFPVHRGHSIAGSQPYSATFAGGMTTGDYSSRQKDPRGPVFENDEEERENISCNNFGDLIDMDTEQREEFESDRLEKNKISKAAQLMESVAFDTIESLLDEIFADNKYYKENLQQQCLTFEDFKDLCDHGYLSSLTGWFDCLGTVI